ncbi:hypothetical protein [Planomicrobium okeanokoites]|uniref:hypothetical protein n=1 Tax=Planomicrobium okeanokoites TaxID=244 RepID=UPI000A0403F4|nr:hypothetical protein [Planomicrobium okeanokoites]
MLEKMFTAKNLTLIALITAVLAVFFDPSTWGSEEWMFILFIFAAVTSPFILFGTALKTINNRR